ncbi:MAG: ATP-binding protein [bacterium]|nr:MAG: ATP-binding protein [bacterium]
MTPTKYSQQAFNVNRRILRELLLRWMELTRDELKPIVKIYQNFNQILSRWPSDDPSIQRFSENLSQFLTNIIQWTENVAQLPEKISLPDLQSKWKKEFHHIGEEIPQSIMLEYDQIFFIAQESDSLLLRIWKRKNKGFKQIQQSWYRLINQIKKIFKLNPSTPATRNRQFSPLLLTEKYLALPAMNLLIDEWQHYLQNLAKLLFELHLHSERLKDLLLFKDGTASMCHHIDVQTQKDFEEILRDTIHKIDEFQTALNHHPEISVARMESKWEDVADNYSRAWSYAGTFALPNRHFNSNRVALEWKKSQKSYSDFHTTWIHHFSAEQWEWEKDLELSLLQIQSAITCNKSVDSVEHKIAEYFIPPFERSKEIIRSSLENFTSVEADNAQELKNIIIKENRELLQALRQDALPKMMDSIIKANIEADVRNYITELSHALDSLSDQHVIFTFRDLENIPPKSKSSEIPLEDLIKADFFKELENQFLSLSREVHTRLEKIVRDISEIDQIVEFNLEAALNLLQEDQAQGLEETQKIVIEGLERTFNQIKELVENSLFIYTLVQEKLVGITTEFENKIQELADSEKILELKIRVAKTRTEEEFRNTLLKIWQTSRRIIPIASRFIYNKLNDLMAYYKKFRKITRLSPQTLNIEEELTNFLTETDRRIKALPYVYQRLFRLSPLVDERFFTGRKDELARIENQYYKWKSGLNAATALVGERGSGKTTLLNFAEFYHFKSSPIIKYDFARTEYNEQKIFEVLKSVFQMDEARDYQDLKGRLEKSEKKYIVICENIQNLFIRLIDGFQGLEQFLLFISETNQQIFWIVTSTLYSWQYLEKVLLVSKYFQSVIQLGDLSEEEVKNIVLKRHRVSGFEIEFTIPEDLLNSRKFKKLGTDDKQQELLQNLFFKDLNDLSNGNITVAMLFWQRAIREVLSDRLVVYPLINIDFSFLYQLSYEELFTLAAFMQHEIINIKQHSQIFHQNETKSALMLNRLHNNGIILPHPNGYHIHPFLYRAIVRTLKSKNILH